MKSDKIKSILIQNSLLFIGLSYLSVPFNRIKATIPDFNISKLAELLSRTLESVKSSPLFIPTAAELKTMGTIGIAMAFFFFYRLTKIKQSFILTITPRAI